MVLSKIKINNFRCFGNQETVIDFDKITTLIGANSSGKTAVLQALVKLFGQTQSEREIHRSDFHLDKGQKPDELDKNELYIEAIFEFPELKNDEKSLSTIPAFFRYFVIDEQNQIPYIRIRLDSTFTKDGTPEGSIDTRYNFIVKSVLVETNDDNKGTINAQRSILSNIKCIYIPAIRNPSEQLKNVSGTILYRLLSGITWNDEVRSQIKKHIGNVNSAVESVQGVQELEILLQKQWSRYHNDSRYNNTKISFNSSDIESIMKNTEIKFSPTELPRDYDISELGDGLRSLFYFSLVNTLLKYEENILKSITNPIENEQQTLVTPPLLTLIAVEEPENHIAPQLMGKVIQNLKEIAKNSNSQVIMSSHTPSIVKRINAINLRYLRMDDVTRTTFVNKITLPLETDEAYKFIKEAVEAYPEIYFSKLVILGEGDSEMLVLPKIIESTKKNIDTLGVTVAPLGGRFVNHFWKLLTQLHIPYITLLDLDKEREGGGWGRIKYALTQLLQNDVKEEDLLSINKNIKLSRTELEKMHTWRISKKMDFWISKLEKYNVYFSSPLDLDFLLLEAYPECYKKTIPENFGPYISGKGKIKELEIEDKLCPEYINRMKKNIKDVLKEEGGKGSTYSLEQKKLMIWYNYLFLNRSKPVTHLTALANCDFSNIEEIPYPLNLIAVKVIDNS